MQVYVRPGLGKSPGGECSHLLQYPCLENTMDRGAWRATVHRVTKSWTWLKWLGAHTHTHTHTHTALMLGEVIWAGTRYLRVINRAIKVKRIAPWREKRARRGSCLRASLVNDSSEGTGQESCRENQEQVVLWMPREQKTSYTLPPWFTELNTPGGWEDEGHMSTKCSDAWVTKVLWNREGNGGWWVGECQSISWGFLLSQALSKLQTPALRKPVGICCSAERWRLRTIACFIA